MKTENKVVIRRLPRGLTEEQFLNVIHPYNKFNYFRFCSADPSHKEFSSARVYIDFYSQDDLYQFKEYVEHILFSDSDGNQSYAIIEYAVFQQIASKAKSDIKQNSLTSDPDFIEFLKDLNDTTRNTAIDTVESNLEEIKNRDTEKSRTTTALIDYITSLRKKDYGRRDDYRRKNNYSKSFIKKESDIVNENDLGHRMEVKSIKKNMNKEKVGNNVFKNDVVKIGDRSDTKPSKGPRRNDSKTYSANYEEYSKETNGYKEDSYSKRIFENKSGRGGRKPMYDMMVDDTRANSGSYYYGNRNDGYYRTYDQYGYSDNNHANYSRPEHTKNSRGGGGGRGGEGGGGKGNGSIRPPPSYSASRRD